MIDGFICNVAFPTRGELAVKKPLGMAAPVCLRESVAEILFDTLSNPLHEPGGAVFQPPRLGAGKPPLQFKGAPRDLNRGNLSPFEAERRQEPVIRHRNCRLHAPRHLLIPLRLL
jgi:hypothetical protein